jgi:hypothetical protein
MPSTPEQYRLFRVLPMQDPLDDKRSLPPLSVHLHFVPGEGATHLALRERDDRSKGCPLVDIGKKIGEARNTVL